MICMTDFEKNTPPTVCDASQQRFRQLKLFETVDEVEPKVINIPIISAALVLQGAAAVSSSPRASSPTTVDDDDEGADDEDEDDGEDEDEDPDPGAGGDGEGYRMDGW